MEIEPSRYPHLLSFIGKILIELAISCDNRYEGCNRYADSQRDSVHYDYVGYMRKW